MDVTLTVVVNIAAAAAVLRSNLRDHSRARGLYESFTQRTCKYRPQGLNTRILL